MDYALDDLRSVRQVWKREVSQSVRSLLTRKKSSAAPRLYVEAGDVERWQQTLRFRSEQNINTILDQAQPDFEKIQAAYPLYIHGRSSTGNAVVVVGLLGKFRTEVEASDRYFSFFHEYISKAYDGEDTRVIFVLDLSGSCFSQLMMSRAVLRAMAQDDLVPYRNRYIIANAPAWFSTAFLPWCIRSRSRVATDFAALFPNDKIPTLYDLESHPHYVRFVTKATSDKDNSGILVATPPMRRRCEEYDEEDLETETNSLDEKTSTWWYERLFV